MLLEMGVNALNELFLFLLLEILNRNRIYAQIQLLSTNDFAINRVGHTLPLLC